MKIGRGRPRVYKTVSALKKKIEQYFNSITKTVQRMETVIDRYEEDDKGKQVPVYVKAPVLNNLLEPVYDTVWLKKPSVLGMCAYLEIDRQQLKYMLDHPIKDPETGEIKQDFSHTIKIAKAIIESYKADQLDRTNNVAGIIFDLKHNHGWRDDHDKLELLRAKHELEKEKFEFQKELHKKGGGLHELLEHLKNIQTVSDLISNPQPNRSIEDE